MKKHLFFLLLLMTFLSAACEDSLVVDGTKKSSEEMKVLLGDVNKAINDSSFAETIRGAESKIVDSVKEAAGNLDNTTVEDYVSKSGATLYKAEVVNVVDGDTIDVLINSQKERIRFILVNTPESKGKYKDNPQPFGIESFEFTKKILQGKTVWIEKGIQDRDQYGRMLTYVWLDKLEYKNNGEYKKFENITFNEILLLEGLAHVAVYPPNTQYIDEFREFESIAKSKKLGIWSK